MDQWTTAKQTFFRVRKSRISTKYLTVSQKTLPFLPQRVHPFVRKTSCNSVSQQYKYLIRAGEAAAVRRCLSSPVPHASSVDEVPALKSSQLGAGTMAQPWRKHTALAENHTCSVPNTHARPFTSPATPIAGESRIFSLSTCVHMHKYIRNSNYFKDTGLERWFSHERLGL